MVAEVQDAVYQFQRRQLSMRIVEIMVIAACHSVVGQGGMLLLGVHLPCLPGDYTLRESTVRRR